MLALQLRYSTASSQLEKQYKMGTAPSRREPEVHVVVVQPREDGNVDPDAIRKAINQEAGGMQ